MNSKQSRWLALINSSSAIIRAEVARYIDLKYLPQMINDFDWLVRKRVARRIDKNYLHNMMNDYEYLVRAEVANRIDNFYLAEMLDDKNWFVREFLEARIMGESCKANQDELNEMLKSDYDVIRAAAAHYINKEKAVLVWATDNSEKVRNIAMKKVLGTEEKYK